MFYTYAVGIDSRHRKGEIVYHYEKRQHYILIYTRTTAQFQIDDEEIPVKKGTLLLISQISVHLIQEFGRATAMTGSIFMIQTISLQIFGFR